MKWKFENLNNESAVRSMAFILLRERGSDRWLEVRRKLCAAIEVCLSFEVGSEIAESAMSAVEFGNFGGATYFGDIVIAVTESLRKGDEELASREPGKSVKDFPSE